MRFHIFSFTYSWRQGFYRLTWYGNIKQVHDWIIEHPPWNGINATTATVRGKSTLATLFTLRNTIVWPREVLETGWVSSLPCLYVLTFQPERIQLGTVTNFSLWKGWEFWPLLGSPKPGNWKGETNFWVEAVPWGTGRPSMRGIIALTRYDIHNTLQTLGVE